VGADSLAPALTGDAPVYLDQFENGLGPQRSYLAAGDLLQVILQLAKAKRVPKVLNVASVASIGMEDIAKAADKEIVWRPAPETAVQNVTLDISKLITTFPDITRQETAGDLIADWRALEAAS
ncbi:MAG: SDR family NAD-dependent epimerase/dehydratase, partial [Pseudomonadota bacterium]